jgi:hypothetical protein
MKILDPKSQENNYKLNVDQAQEELREKLMALYNMDLKDFELNLNFLIAHSDEEMDDIIEPLMDAYSHKLEMQ